MSTKFQAQGAFGCGDSNPIYDANRIMLPPMYNECPIQASVCLYKDSTVRAGFILQY